VHPRLWLNDSWIAIDEPNLHTKANLAYDPHRRRSQQRGFVVNIHNRRITILNILIDMRPNADMWRKPPTHGHKTGHRVGTRMTQSAIAHAHAICKKTYRNELEAQNSVL